MEKTFLNKLARVISTIFVPPSFTLILFAFFALSLERTIENKLLVFLTALIFGFILHVILFLYFRKKGKLVDLDASIKEERTIPFLISVLIYAAGLLILLFAEAAPVSIAFWFCYISNTLLVVIINKLWKISVHSMGAAGPLAALFFAAGDPALYFIPLVLLVGWSRIRLKCHTPAQVAAGLLFGFFSTYVQLNVITGFIHYAR